MKRLKISGEISKLNKTEKSVNEYLWNSNPTEIVNVSYMARTEESNISLVSGIYDYISETPVYRLTLGQYYLNNQSFVGYTSGPVEETKQYILKTPILSQKSPHNFRFLKSLTNIVGLRNFQTQNNTSWKIAREGDVYAIYPIQNGDVIMNLRQEAPALTDKLNVMWRTCSSTDITSTA